jgi:hypothetical protein
MSEHGWPDFHDDHGDHGHDDGGPHHDDADALVPPHEDVDVALHHEDDDSLWQHDEPAEVPSYDDHSSYEHHAESPVDAEEEPWTPPEHDMGLVGADPDALDAHADPDPVDMFPQVVDVGPLPEPVDGFPWIDTGSLGVVDAAAAGVDHVEVSPHELAAYAGTDVAPGADPWAALADSDDPATSALARWWSQHPQP